MENRKENLIIISKNEMADILLHYIYVAQQEDSMLIIEEKGETTECEAIDFYSHINIDIMDIDEDNDDFISCKYINDDIVILEYANRIIKITK
jgi:hypothetical protein